MEVSFILLIFVSTNQINKMANAAKIIKNFDPIAIKIDANGSVLIKDKKSKLLFWVDVWRDGTELTWDWNQYIFHTDNPGDMLKKEIQESADVADLASSVAREYFENNLK